MCFPDHLSRMWSICCEALGCFRKQNSCMGTNIVSHYLHSFWKPWDSLNQKSRATNEGVRLPVEGVLSVCTATVCLPMTTSSNKSKELWGENSLWFS